MYFSKINLEETHIRLKTDLADCDLKDYIFSIRRDLKNYIRKNNDFLISLEPIEDDDGPEIVQTMIESSNNADVGPMACVAGTISEMSMNYLIHHGSKNSIVENGGDISIINDRESFCGIYSNNEILGNKIAFKLKPRKKPLGICTSSGKIGHSISFGQADSVSVVSSSPSLGDGLATRIANEVSGNDSETKVANALECCENYKEFFDGVLIISQDNVGVIGRLPEIVETDEFALDL